MHLYLKMIHTSHGTPARALSRITFSFGQSIPNRACICKLNRRLLLLWVTSSLHSSNLVLCPRVLCLVARPPREKWGFGRRPWEAIPKSMRTKMAVLLSFHSLLSSGRACSWPLHEATCIVLSVQTDRPMAIKCHPRALDSEQDQSPTKCEEDVSSFVCPCFPVSSHRDVLPAHPSRPTKSLNE